MGWLHHHFPTKQECCRHTPKSKGAGFKPAPAVIAGKPGIDGKPQALVS